MARPLPAAVCWLHPMRPPCLPREAVTPQGAAPHAPSARAYGAAGSWQRTPRPTRGGGGTPPPPARQGGGAPRAPRVAARRSVDCSTLPPVPLRSSHGSPTTRLVGGRSAQRSRYRSATARHSLPLLIPARTVCAVRSAGGSRRENGATATAARSPSQKGPAQISFYFFFCGVGDTAWSAADRRPAAGGRFFWQVARHARLAVPLACAATARAGPPPKHSRGEALGEMGGGTRSVGCSGSRASPADQCQL